MLHRRGHAGPGGRFLGDHHGAGAARGDHLVDVLKEGDGLEIFATAKHIRRPLAMLAAVVAVKHGRHRVDAQAIDMEILQPAQGAGGQESENLAPTKIIDQRVPVLVETLARVFMLEQRRAVEAREAMFIGREMRGHPVNDHADVLLVAGVDETDEILRVAKFRRGGEQG